MSIVSQKLRDSAGHYDARRFLNVNGEEWRPVAGYEGYYEVSSLGRVRSLDRRLVQIDGKARFFQGRVIAQSLTAGYMRVCLCRHGENESHLVHRLVAAAFVDGSGDVCRHIDGDAENNAAINLKWGTQKENIADKGRHGTTAVGERHGMATMNEADVICVRAMHAAGIRICDICRQTGFGRTAVGFAVHRKTWRHLP